MYPLVIVSDNGPAFKSDLFLRFILANPALEHVRTRYRAPQTNGVVERWTGTLQYDHLYRIEIASGHDLARECETYRLTYNEVRPHESLAFSTPDSVYRALPTSPPRPVPGRFCGIQSVGPDAEAGADERLVKQPKLFLAQTVQKS